MSARPSSPLRNFIAALAVPFALTLAPRASHAGAPVSIVVTTRDGRQQAVEFRRYDAKKLVFKFRTGKSDFEVPLRGIAAIQFPPVNPSLSPLASGPQDVMTGRDDKPFRAVLMDMDGRKVHARMSDGSERDIDLAWFRNVVFSLDVYDVDRRTFGGGFNLFGDASESQMAAVSGKQVEAGVPILADTLVENYVGALGRRIAAASKRPDLPYEFHVLNSGQINAFTVGGGRVYVYRGLLEQMGDESELAGVIAHEIGHNVGRHTVKQASRTLLMNGIVAVTGEVVAGGDAKTKAMFDRLGGAAVYFGTLKYSRDDEREADYLGVYNLVEMGIDPHGMVSAFETLKKNEGKSPAAYEVFFQTHPALDERIANTQGELDKFDPGKLEKDTPAFRRMMAHLATLPRPVAREKLLDDTLAVAAATRAQRSWTIDPAKAPNGKFCGTFRAYGGSGNDIRVLFLDDVNYLNYCNNHPAKPLYDSGVRTAGEWALPVTVQGTYHLVFENSFSFLTPKNVLVHCWLEYTE